MGEGHGVSTPVIPVFGRWRQKAQEFKTSLNYMRPLPLASPPKKSTKASIFWKTPFVENKNKTKQLCGQLGLSLWPLTSWTLDNYFFTIPQTLQCKSRNIWLEMRSIAGLSHCGKFFHLIKKLFYPYLSDYKLWSYKITPQYCHTPFKNTR